MDRYKLKFTVLQQEIFRFLCIYAGKSFTSRSLARKLNVSPTAIAKSLPILKRGGFVIAEKDEDSGRMSISLNLENPKTLIYKRGVNLEIFYESGISDFLSNKFPHSDIFVCGNYSQGTDNYDSVLEIYISSDKKIDLKPLNLSDYEDRLAREISVNLFSYSKLNSNLKNKLFGGVLVSAGEFK